jgi:hypothetical protein
LNPYSTPTLILPLEGEELYRVNLPFKGEKIYRVNLPFKGEEIRDETR